MSFERVGEFPQEEQAPTFERVGTINEIPTMDVLAGVPERAMLQARTALGGGMEMFGDLLRLDSLAAVGADIAKASREEAAASMPLGASPIQMGASAGLESGAVMAVPAALGGFAPMMATAVGTTVLPRYSELREAGFSGGRAGFHAALDGMAEYVGERSGLKALSNIGLPILRRVSEFAVRDMVGEQVTNFYQQLNALLSDNPDMTIGEFLDSAKMTAIATPFAAGAQIGAAMGGAAVRGELSGQPPAAADGTPPPQQERPGEVMPQPPVERPAPTAEPDDTPAPPGEAPAPTKDKPYEWGAWAKATDPASGEPSYTHPSGVGILPYKYGSALGWDLVSPNGDTILHGFKTPEEAHKRAQEYEWDADLTNTIWDWDERKTLLVNKEYPEFIIGKRPGGWQLIGPNGDIVSNHKGKLLEFLPAANKNILEALVNKAVPPPPNDGFLSMFEATPEEMQAAGKVDPRLYNGQFHGIMDKRIEAVRDSNGVWWMELSAYNASDSQANKPPTRVKLGDTREAWQELARVTGVTFTDAQFVSHYNQAVIEGAVNDLEGSNRITSRVMDRFGGQLEELRQLGRQKADALNDAAAIVTLPEPRIAAYNANLLLPKFQLPTNVAPVAGGLTETGIEVVNHRVPGTYVDNATVGGGLLRIAGAVERLRKVFTPNAVIIFGEHGTGAGNGVTRAIRDNVYLVLVGTGHSTKRTDLGQALKAAFHEFGHVVAYEYLVNGPADVKARLTASWLRYTKDVHGDSSLAAYMREFHSDPRAIDPKRSIRSARTYSSYAMSMSEYLADQAAQYFLERESSGFDSVLRQFYEGFLELLQKLFAMFPNVTGIHKDTTFYEFLDELAGHDYRAAPARPNGPKGLPPTAPEIGAKPPTSQVIKNRAHAEALIHKQMKMWDLLVQAGATKEELDALNPTNNIKDFRWTEAYALLDKYGVPRRYYLDSYSVGSVDDTLHFREQLFELNRQVKDTELRHWLGKSSSDIKSFNWILQKTMTAVQLRKRYGQQVPGVKVFVDTLEAMFAYRSRWKEQADDRLKEMKHIPHAKRLKLFDLMLDEDKTGEYQSVITVDAVGRRIFTLKEAAVTRYGLGPLEIEAYSKIRSDFNSVLEEMEVVSIAEMERLYGVGTPALHKAVAELKDAFAQMKAKPYVPHTRFGEYTVVVKSEGRIQEFYQFESEGDAIAKEKELRGSVGAGSSVSRGRLTEQQRIMMGLPPQLINAMKGHLKLSPEQISEFENILKDMTHGASFVRRFKRRKNVEGWEDDAENFPRAYADYMSRAANHLSRIKYNHELTAAKGLVRQQAGQRTVDMEGQNTVELDELGNWLGRLQDYVNDPQQEFTAARAAATLWYLGFNVKSAMVNSTQVAFVTLPYLAKRYGDARAFAAVMQAYKDVASQYVRKQALTDDERRMFERAREMGVTDQSFATELAGVREGGRLAEQMALSRKASAFYTLKYWGMLPFQKIEVLNRQTTMLAAYRLARTSRSFAEADVKGYDRAAFEFAKSSVQDTQNENAQWNRPQFMRGKKSILTLFMSFQQNMLYQMLGGDPAWMRLLATQMLVAGLMGLPFAQDASDLIKWFASKVLGKDFSPERAIRSYVVDFAGPKAEWIMKGLTFDMAGVNLQGSISQGRVIPGIEALSQEGKFTDRLANAAGDVGGAGFSIILNAMRAISSDDPQLTKRVSVMLPEFAKSAIEGVQMLTEGVAKDRAGNKLADVGTEHSLARAFGFQVTDVSQARAKRFAQKDNAAHWLARRQAVFNIFEIAVDSGDPEWMDKARAAVKEFNDEAPDYGLRISGKQLRSSLRSRQRSDARVEAGIGPSRSVQQTYSRIGELYQRE